MMKEKILPYVQPLRNLHAAMMFLLLLLYTACMPSSDTAQPAKEKQLPPITTEGKNTFGCKINGKVWLPYTKPNIFGGLPPVEGDYGKNDKSFSVLAYYWPEDDLDEQVAFYITPLDFEADSILLIHYKTKKFAGYWKDNPKPSTAYLTDSINIGYVRFLRLDTVNRIASGTFWFTGVNEKGEKVSVTEGRFDVSM